MARWFRAARAATGFDQEGFGRYIGKSRQAVGFYESGDRRVPTDVAATILTEFPDTPKPPIPGDVELVGRAVGDDRVATIIYAGVVPCSSDWGDPLSNDEKRPIESKFAGRNRFMCKVTGDSCYPALVQGDFTIWEKDSAPPYGTIILAEREGDGACTVKEFRYDGASRKPVLVAINPNETSPDDREGWRATARLIGVIRRDDGPEQTWFHEPGLRPKHLIPKIPLQNL